jgi:uncharacterized repeat protein (TIGR01451 family)
MTRIPCSVSLAAFRGAAAAALVMPVAVTPAVTHPATPGRATASRAIMATPPPSLSIAVSDGQKTARPGDVLGYVVTVRDVGSAGLAGLTLTQALPPAFRVRSAGGGAVRAGTLTWRLRPQAAVSFRVSGQVGALPPRLLRLATIACVTVGRGGKPIVCAADSDALPAASSASANPGGGRARALAPVPAGRPVPAYALALAGLGVLAAVAVLARRRLSRRRLSGSRG